MQTKLNSSNPKNSMTHIQVVGHKNPDTDATLSAIIMADYLTQRGYSATPYIQGELNKETLYLLETLSIQKPEIASSLSPEHPVALVDHNEASQAPDNISELSVEWIVDHHKINFSSQSPLNIRIEPICSTASILYKMYQESGLTISQEIAQMMLACIMSDSLLWKSPTSTDEDKAIAAKLQEIAGISDLEAFAMPMFEAKSDLGDMPATELVQYDYKIGEVNGRRMGVGTLETTNPGYALGRKQEILTALTQLKSQQNLDFIMLSVVDILEENNITIALEEDMSVLTQVFSAEDSQDNTVNLGRRLSRKKQIIPDLTAYFESL